MEASERRTARLWMIGVLLAVVTLFGLVMAKLVQLHVVEYKPRNYQTTFSLLGLRGRILDRNGNVLAASLPGREVYVDQNDPKFKALPPERQAELPLELADMLGVSQEKMIDAFTGYRTNASGRRITTRKICEISDDAVIRDLEARASRSVAATNRIAGVNFYNKISVRSHPNGASLSHVLGYTNKEGDGVYGIEQRFDSLLKGKDGRVVTLLDARRREVRDRRKEETEPIPGADIYLTIDNNIQNIIERELAEALRTYQADSGIIIVQAVKTGEILGMATLPSFNPQEYSSFPEHAWKNIAISRNYEPGSIMKVATVATALQNKVITERTKFDVGTSGIWYYAGRPLRDHAYGELTAKEILAKSSNIGTAMIGLRFSETLSHPLLGKMEKNELLWNAFRSMGFGQSTGIELVGEEAGIVPHYSKWSKLSPTRMTIGQGIAVTAMQMCNAYATIGNMGVRMKPTIISAVKKHEDETPQKREPEVLGHPLSEKVCKSMLSMMTAVTDPLQGGTGTRARLRSYTVAGKTGTGQIPINGSYNHADYNASFVGIYPASSPQLAILVTIERPKGRYKMGGSVAAPVFGAVAEDIGRYLSIPPDKPLEEEKP